MGRTSVKNQLIIRHNQHTDITAICTESDHSITVATFKAVFAGLEKVAASCDQCFNCGAALFNCDKVAPLSKSDTRRNRLAVYLEIDWRFVGDGIDKPQLNWVV